MRVSGGLGVRLLFAMIRCPYSWPNRSLEIALDPLRRASEIDGSHSLKFQPFALAVLAESFVSHKWLARGRWIASAGLYAAPRLLF